MPADFRGEPLDVRLADALEWGLQEARRRGVRTAQLGPGFEALAAALECAGFHAGDGDFAIALDPGDVAPGARRALLLLGRKRPGLDSWAVVRSLGFWWSPRVLEWVPRSLRARMAEGRMGAGLWIAVWAERESRS